MLIMEEIRRCTTSGISYRIDCQSGLFCVLMDRILIMMWWGDCEAKKNGECFKVIVLLRKINYFKKSMNVIFIFQVADFLFNLPCISLCLLLIRLIVQTYQVFLSHIKSIQMINCILSIVNVFIDYKSTSFSLTHYSSMI